MKNICFLFATSLLSSGSLASEQSGWYFGASFSVQEIENQSVVYVDKQFESAGIVGGYRLDEYFSVEARLNKGVSSHKSKVITVQGRGEYEDDLSLQYSLLFKADYPIYEDFNLYLLAGVNKTEKDHITRRTTPDGKVVNLIDEIGSSDSGFTYGLGVSYEVSPRLALLVDYQVLPDEKFDFTLIDAEGNRSEQEASSKWEALNFMVTYRF